MSKERFEQARELISQQRYDEARQLLQTLDHPKAQEWLNKLEKIAPSLAPYAPPPPSSYVQRSPSFLSETPPPPTFESIRSLIQAQRYAEARVALQQLEGNPKAQEWLTKLDQLDPQFPPAPSAPQQVIQIGLTQAEVNQQIQTALKEQQRKTKRRGGIGLGCWLRSCLSLSFMLCSCISILPILLTLGNMLNIPQLEAAQQAYSSMQESAVGQLVDSTLNTASDAVVGTTIQLAAPVIEPIVEQNCASAPDAEMCQEMVNQTLDCFSDTSSTAEACFTDMLASACESLGGDATAYQECMSSLSGFDLGSLTSSLGQ
ncbi:MAG: hypothetical protein ACOYLB_11700 [Phototrophicaceae bacterium]